MNRMNDRYPLAGLLVLALAVAPGAAPAAQAAAVTLAPVAISAPLQADLAKKYGAGEGPALIESVRSKVERELKDAGASLADGAPVRIEISIESATPTHPTRWQLQQNPSLDYLRSISRGGAHLRAVLRGANGQELERVDYDRYAPSLREASMSGGAWGDADRAIEGFATQLAQAWRRHAAG
ncbi:MAG TPA: hypothetical protein VMT49_02300 [Steroidobacteraceae bacterium]|nr:hypothetical protein [Steroidobacteraceae bacterium]